MKRHLTTILLVLAGCGAVDDPASSNQPEIAASFENDSLDITTQNRAPTGPLGELVPTVSIALQNGNTVDIYNFHKAALVLERGEAYTAPRVPALAGSMRADRLVELFHSLRPDLPVPAGLVDLQRELTTARGPAPTQEAARKLTAEAQALSQAALVAPGGVSGGGQVAHTRDGIGVQTNSLIGCNNGCCDTDWTRNTLCSDYTAKFGWDYTWYLFNYGWSYANSSSNWYYGGTMCSATGTSTFRVSVGDGDGGTWSVLQQHYLLWWWAAGTDYWGNFNMEPVSSSVNSSTDSHLHMYCGGFSFR